MYKKILADIATVVVMAAIGVFLYFFFFVWSILLGHWIWPSLEYSLSTYFVSGLIMEFIFVILGVMWLSILIMIFPLMKLLYRKMYRFVEEYIIYYVLYIILHIIGRNK